ncbi:MAG: 4Fe-4S binding protein, partial [Anaerolineae bacterium]|nr:4Fe-4S binding protein [Anaerolineae bacterium]
FDIGGGIAEGRAFKAVQTGGPSGGCLPASHLDTPVDYESLTAAGSIMGSGGLVVMDDRNCAVDIAHYFLSFTQAESCGKCPPCRVGTQRMLWILESIQAGTATMEDLDLLESLAQTVKAGSLCGLGQTAPNPVLTTLRYFRSEYEAHVRDRRCPAGVCRALITYRITDECTGCTLCARLCPMGAISGQRKQKHVIDPNRCERCGACLDACSYQAIVVD